MNIKMASAGDRLAPRALRRLASIDPTMEPTVRRRSASVGSYLCADCGAQPHNNMMAATHAESHPRHRLAWLTQDGVEEI